MITPATLAAVSPGSQTLPTDGTFILLFDKAANPQPLSYRENVTFISGGVLWGSKRTKRINLINKVVRAHARAH